MDRRIRTLQTGHPTAAAVEAAVATHQLAISQLEDRSIEDALFPDLVGLFADLTYHSEGFPPSQESFINGFAVRYADIYPHLFGRCWPATQARLRNTQPSLLRELHLALLLEELGLICLRDTRADQQHGVDLIIISGRLAVGLATYVSTRRGRMYRQSRRRRWLGLEIDMPLDPNKALNVGKYWLYTRADAQRVADEVARLGEKGPSEPGTRIIRRATRRRRAVAMTGGQFLATDVETPSAKNNGRQLF